MTKQEERTFHFILRFFNKAYGFKVSETVYDDKFTKQTFKNVYDWSYSYKKNLPTNSTCLKLYRDNMIISVGFCNNLSEIMGTIDAFDIIIRKQEN